MSLEPSDAFEISPQQRRGLNSDVYYNQEQTLRSQTKRDDLKDFVEIDPELSSSENEIIFESLRSPVRTHR